MKLKYILPVATIASAATIVTPLVTSCANSSFVLDESFEFLGFTLLKTKHSADLKSGKTYTAKIDVSDLGESARITKSSVFMVAKEVAASSEFPDMTIFDCNDLTVDGTKLTKTIVKDEADLKQNEFAIIKFTDEGKTSILLYIGPNTLTKTSKIVIKFTPNDSTNDMYCYFGFMQS